MKVTYIIALLIYVFFLMRFLNSRYRISELLLFSVIAAPGISIGGTLINFIDLVVPFLFLWYFLFRRNKIRFSSVEICFAIFAYLCFLSIVFNLYNMVSLSRSLLQAFRIVIVVMLFLLSKPICTQSPERLNHTINIYGLVSCFFAFVIFIEQGTIYDSPELLWIGDITLHRMGGVFGEAATMGFMSIIFTVSALGNLHSREKSYRYTAIALVIMSIFCNIFSYTRISNVALLLVLIIVFLRRVTLQKVIILVSVGIIGLFCIATIPILQNFFFDRMMSLLQIGGGRTFNDVSSGRADVWGNAWNIYVNSNHWLFGVGYKNGLITDNAFLMCLTQLGIFGFIVGCGFFFSLFVNWRRVRDYRLILLALALVVVSLSSDVLTYYRPLSLMFILLQMIERQSLKRPLNAGGLKSVREKYQKEAG